TGQVGAIVPTGAISFKFFANGTCTGDGTAVGNATANESVDSAALTAGSYSYQASVAGDANYNRKTRGCEPLPVGKADLAISTVVYNGQNPLANPGAIPAGATPIVHDTATATGQVGAIAPTGAITFQFFTNGTCNGTPAGNPAATQNGLSAFSA